MVSSSALFRSHRLWLLLAVSAPFVIGLVQLGLHARSPFYLFGDQALIDIAVHRSLQLLQLTGPYSRFGWDHPGPLYYFLLAPGYLILGGGGLGIYLGALLMNWAFVILTAVLVIRSCKPREASALVLAISIFLFALGPFALQDPWNPAIVVLPLLAAAVAVAVRPSVFSLCIVAISCSLAFQAHVGTVSVVSSILLTTIVVHLAAVRGGPWLFLGAARWIPRARSIGLVALVLFLCWLPPIVEQIANGREGNFSRVVYFNIHDNGQERHSLEEAARAVIGSSWLPSIPTLLPPISLPGSIWNWFSLWLFLSILGGALAWRCRLRSALTFCLFAGIGLIVATLAVSRISGAIEVYLLWWVCLPFVALIAGWLILIFGEGGLLERAPARAVSAVVALALASWTVANVALALTNDTVTAMSKPEVHALHQLMSDDLQARKGAVRIQTPDPEVMPYVSGVAATLISSGFPVNMDENLRDDFDTRESSEPPIATYKIAKLGSGNDRGGTFVGSVPGNVPISLRSIP